ncbi:HAD hydrolase-like protein [Verrucomicrobium sp. BvORR106]|uniref:HAD hydrolase-like protein n=1 Tax=Verrucomicrobium sp. BvORR106 TaxID=1403819 RepID=UPI0005718497|nr:HAD hydrolase-like protein [Verrucomicrobium sp. BvORR106]
MKYRLVIFDFDGTLADSVPWMMGVADEIADRHHFPRLTDADREAIRGPEAASIPRLLKIPRWKLVLIARDGRRMMAAKLHEIQLYPGAADLLRHLSENGVRIAIVSSNSESNIRQILGESLASLVEQYECGASFFGKSRKLRKVIRKSGLPAESILSVGDEMRDLTASLDVGLPFGGVSWGICHATALREAGATVVFDTIGQISDIVLSAPAPASL